MWRYAHKKRVVRITSSGGVAVAYQERVVDTTNCSGVAMIPLKESGLHHKISSSQVVIISDGLETLIVGLMEL
ncbi:hypothetical protein Syun_025735 [Stephania yunnanensis]|uniref:Uncharacterized protein n=1 Tax=Stephania yunnanensis TaxID=152371 RepID=A0AAP0EUU5_9MAGN